MLAPRGGPAVFDDDIRLVVALHIRQRFGENAGDFMLRSAHGRPHRDNLALATRRVVAGKRRARKNRHKLYLEAAALRSRSRRAMAARSSGIPWPVRAEVAMTPGKAAGRL